MIPLIPVFSFPMPSGSTLSPNSPVTTTTGEPYLPTRLVYRVSNAAKVARFLKSQPSFAFDPNQDRWVWEIHPSLRRTRSIMR